MPETTDTTVTEAAAGADAAEEGAQEQGAGSAPPEATKPSGKKTTRRQRSATRAQLDGTELTDTTVTEEGVATLPATVTLACPFAYYDDAGDLHSWGAGRVVTDADEIADLAARGAIFEAE